MKKSILFLVSFVVMLAFTAGRFSYTPKANTAEVEQMNGLYVFIKCKPVNTNKFLGKVDMPGIVMSGKPAEMTEKAVKRAKKQFPEANAIIIKSDNYGEVEAFKVED